MKLFAGFGKAKIEKPEASLPAREEPFRVFDEDGPIDEGHDGEPQAAESQTAVKARGNGNGKAKLSAKEQEALAGLPPQRGVELVTESRNWFVTQSRQLFNLCLLLGGALIISLSCNVVQVMTRPKPVYFAATPDFRILEMPPLSAPVVSDQAIVNWTTDVVTKALSLDFLHWRKKLMDVRIDFDPDGFKSFVNSLTSTGNLKKIEAERLNLSCVLKEAAVITNSGVVNGKMTWRIEAPLLLSYQSSRGVVSSQDLIGKILVQRTSTTRNPKGVVIKQIVLTRAGT